MRVGAAKWVVCTAVVSVTVLSLAGACADSSNPVAMRGSQNAADVSVLQSPTLAPARKTLDEQFVELAQTIRGFGGYYIAQSGRVVVLLTDMAEASHASGILKPQFDATTSLRHRAMEFRPAQYDAQQLASWHKAIDALPLGGVVYTDLDEVNNRVTVAVAEGDAGARIRRDAMSAGVPSGALRIVMAAPIRFVTDTFLNMVHRPVYAGMEMDDSVPGVGYRACTIGFSAYNSQTASFVTASHCDATYGGIDSFPAYQASHLYSGSEIGHEAVDPAFSASLSGCPSGYSCRYSDASVWHYDTASTQYKYGMIAQTTSASTSWGTSGSTKLAASPFIPGSMVSDANLVVGDSLNKVGITTGWTKGSITASCVTVPVSVSHQLLCQYESTTYVDEGDSGSPVFSFDTYGDAQWAGIIWGADTVNFRSYFSSSDEIQRDLGILSSCKLCT